MYSNGQAAFAHHALAVMQTVWMLHLLLFALHFERFCRVVLALQFLFSRQHQAHKACALQEQHDQHDIVVLTCMHACMNAALLDRPKFWPAY